MNDDDLKRLDLSVQLATGYCTTIDVKDLQALLAAAREANRMRARIGELLARKETP